MTHFSCEDCENICASSYYRHQIRFLQYSFELRFFILIFRLDTLLFSLFCFKMCCVVWSDLITLLFCTLCCPLVLFETIASHVWGRFTHDDVIKWKHFPCYWPFVRGIHRYPVTRSFDVFFDLQPNKRFSKQWWVWWFETPSCLLWRHRNTKKYKFLP